METIIHAEALTTFDVSPDGCSVRFNVRDAQGGSGSLELPASCLNQLLATLPKIIQQTLRRQHRDNSLRVTYPMETFGLDLGEVDQHGVRQYILTLQTGGAFEISFATPASQLGALAQAVIDQVLATEDATLEPVTLNS